MLSDIFASQKSDFFPFYQFVNLLVYLYYLKSISQFDIFSYVFFYFSKSRFSKKKRLLFFKCYCNLYDGAKGYCSCSLIASLVIAIVIHFSIYGAQSLALSKSQLYSTMTSCTKSAANRRLATALTSSPSTHL